ncbi:TetR/AcrR family transcriptional regulator, partial [Streptomyces parvus]
LGPATPPHRRIPALLDAVLCFKLDNRHLALALEDTGDAGPYRAEHYERWHRVLRDMLDRIDGRTDSAFAAHALLAATRADLVEHLITRQGMSHEEIRAQLARYAVQVIGSGTPDV